MEELLERYQRFGRLDRRLVMALEDGGLVPGKRTHRHVAYARRCRGNRELPQHGRQADEHLRLGEAGKPEIQVEFVGHASVDFNRSRLNRVLRAPSSGMTESRRSGKLLRRENQRGKMSAVPLRPSDAHADLDTHTRG